MQYFPHVLASCCTYWARNEKAEVHPKARASSAEVPVREDERGDEGPEVEAEAQPAGAHLHPHGRHVALHLVGFSVWSGGGRRANTQLVKSGEF